MSIFQTVTPSPARPAPRRSSSSWSSASTPTGGPTCARRSSTAASSARPARPAARASASSREFIYIELGRGQYIGVWPLAQRGDWRDCAARTPAGLRPRLRRAAPGPRRASSAPGVALRVGVRLAGAAREAARGAGRHRRHDARAGQAGRVAQSRARPAAGAPGAAPGRGCGQRRCSWPGSTRTAADRSRRCEVACRADREIEAEAPAWQALRDELLASPLVDFQRELLGR